MDVELPPAEANFVKKVTAFARDEVAPQAARWEVERRVPLDTFRAGAALGLAGMLVPRDLGGLQLSNMAMALSLEALATASMAFGFSLSVQHNVAAGIAKYGNRAQIDRFLPNMLAGRRIGAFCLTEPETGSDAAAITTNARASDGGWVINGQKAWITNGVIADLFTIYAQTDPSRGWRGIACFLVQGDNPGLVRENPYDLMGSHAMGTNGLRMNECRIEQDAMLIGPGDGFKGAMSGINRARMVIAAMCCGMLRGSLEAALDYAGKRRAFGQTIANFQGLQWELAEVATDLAAALALTLTAARALDRGEIAALESAHAKKYATRAALTGVSTCMRMMGANGYRAERPLGRHLADAQMAQYLDGTDEIQNIVISRALFANPGRSRH